MANLNYTLDEINEEKQKDEAMTMIERNQMEIKENHL